MRKYDVLKAIFESNDGATATELAMHLKTSLPNVYVYLKELTLDNLIRKTSNSKFIANKTNRSLQQILDLQAMAPDTFPVLVSPNFKKLLNKFCEKIETPRAVFTQSELRKIETIAKVKRIVLRLSRRPAKYCLKINEPLTETLLEYHRLTPNFSKEDFDLLLDRTKVPKQLTLAVDEESAPEIKKKCDKLYEEGKDLLPLAQAKDFTPDEKIAALLRTVDQTNTEYRLFLVSLDPNTASTILDQWKKKYVYNTNKIEGNTMSENDVGKFLLTGKGPEHISKRELHETTNTSNALDFLELKHNEAISEELIRELHFMVQKDIAPSPGEYKKFYNHVHHSPTTPPQHVAQRLKQLLKWYAKNRGFIHPIVLASVFHMQFEVIHPFGDGNGRVGRLLMNHILKQQGYLPVTILEKTKDNYYRPLANRSIPQFLEYLLTTMIEEYKRG